MIIHSALCEDLNEKLADAEIIKNAYMRFLFDKLRRQRRIGLDRLAG
jgi:hypothetical protein